MNKRDTLNINEKNHLEIGGCDTLELAKMYGTPQYVIDAEYILSMVNVFSTTISENYGKGRVYYASKAFSTKAMYSLLKSTGCGCDVVSGGEIYTAIEAGFDPLLLEFHGNNKLPREIAYAIEVGVRKFCLDGYDDVYRVNQIAGDMGVKVECTVRVNPGVSAHTHEFIRTAEEDSKFGLSIKKGYAIKEIEAILSCPNLIFKGIHCHIGSQIFDYEGFVEASRVMTDFMLEIKNTLNVEIEELNMGGGFGIYYEGEDLKFNRDTYKNHLLAMIVSLNSELSAKNLKKPFLCIEPGRSIVGEAGITLYTVGAIKDIVDIRKYIMIDGGMFDNPRYALYGAKYSACVCNKAGDEQNEVVTMAGKCCESGDIISKDMPLQSVAVGDLVAVFSTGAYNYSMASNYNRNFVPPVVMCYKGKSGYAVLPQTYADIVRNDVVPDFIDDIRK